jgi:formate dehydrogenase major subunit
MAPSDARILGIDDGLPVRLRSRYGEITIPAKVSEVVAPGQLFATFQSPEVFVNRITGRNRDRFVQTPEYKITAVQVERVTAQVVE